jgi:hypothetical protein
VIVGTSNHLVEDAHASCRMPSTNDFAGTLPAASVS